ncbi:HSP20-like chaperone [Flammula alnicola]|nr:HSP20-like chaperone [Flammula alnicola]
MDLIDDMTSSNIIVDLEMPGVDVNDISLQLCNGQLVISGKRRSPHGQNSNRALPNPEARPVRELKYGRFYRALPLPGGMEATAVSAILERGVLSLKWPRLVDVTERLIPPSTSSNAASQT